MANVFGVHPSNPTQGIESTGKPPSKGVAVPIGGKPDTASLAEHLAAGIRGAHLVRTELVQRVRAEIASGTYETPERIDATVDRLLDELFPDVVS